MKTDKGGNFLGCGCLNSVKKYYEKARKSVFGETEYVNFKFENADMTSDFMRKCETYADKFGSGGKQFSILLYGDVGRGKTFAAACIANRLIDRGFSVMFTSVSRFERGLWAEDVDKSTVYDQLTKPDLLIIDDLASERATDYMHEIQFNILQTRIDCGRPMAVTTNLTAAELSKPNDLRMARTTSRLLKNAYALLCDGADRRLESFKANSAVFEKYLS